MSDILEETKYPHLDRLERLEPGPQVALGTELFWTLKADGSNVGIALVDGEPHIRSRNLPRAQMDVYTALKISPQWAGILDLLTSASDWGDQYVLFGELCQKGKSPTRIKTHAETHFVPFDLWSMKNQRFEHYVKFHQECIHAGLEPIELMGTCNVATLEELYEFERTMLDECKARGEEGCVAKGYIFNDFNKGDNAGTKRGIIYFKSKIDLPRLEKIPRMESDDRVKLPPLPDSEIFGAIEKVRVDLGESAFRDIKQAMTLVARYIQEECKKHLCESPGNIHQYYQQRLRDLQ